MLAEGRVVKSTGSFYQVQFPDGSVQECRIIGKFRLGKSSITNPVAVGDQVRVDPGTHLIKEILPRKNYVLRQSPRKKHELHFLASNVDQAMLIVTLVEPNLKLGFIDRFLLMTEPYNIPVIIVVNKSDLWAQEEQELFLGLRAAYERIGHTVIPASIFKPDELRVLAGCLKDKVTMIGGQSGVGKSSLINAIQPGMELRVQEISDYSGKGQHTTTFAEMHPLAMGGAVIDTPGIKTLAFNHLEPMDVAHNFREFFRMSGDCKFGGSCTHRNEPGCAVRNAVESGEIAPWRYENYLQILQEIEDINYWERKTDF